MCGAVQCVRLCSVGLYSVWVCIVCEAVQCGAVQCVGLYSV